MKKSLTIRGHHLLCILGFRGKGYSEKFVANMERIVEQYQGNPKLKIEVVDYCDDICRACPHLAGKICRQSEGSADRLEAMDRDILDRLGLASGQLVTVEKIVERLKDRIKAHHLTEICRDCRWLSLGYCHEGLKRGGVID